MSLLAKDSTLGYSLFVGDSTGVLVDISRGDSTSRSLPSRFYWVGGSGHREQTDCIGCGVRLYLVLCLFFAFFRSPPRIPSNP